MSNEYNLDDAAKLKGDSFTFTLGGQQYQFKYPTVEESEKFQDMKDDQGEPDTKKIMDAIYKFITPVGDAPPIAEAMKKVTSPILKEFNRMITVELGVE